MSRPCGTVAGCGGVSTAGVTFPSGGGCPPAILSLQFGEIAFARIPNFALLLEFIASGGTAGDPCGGDIPFTFVTTAAMTSGSELAGPVFSQVTLNSLSTPNFSASGNGRLKYFGPTEKFVVSFDTTLNLISTTSTAFAQFPSAPLALISVFICKNGVAIQSSAESALMAAVLPFPSPFPTSTEHTFSGQALVQLRAGDELELCIADLFNSANGPFTPPSPTDMVCISQLSLIAQQ